MQECDTLIIAGSGFPYMEFYPKPGQAKTVQIDIDPARIGLRHPVEVGLGGRLPGVLARPAAADPNRRTTRAFSKKSQKRMKKWNELMEERGTAHGQCR